MEGRVTPEAFGEVTTVVITHDHPDHLDVPALKQILAKGSATVVGNGEVAAKLGREGIAVEVLEEGTRRVGVWTLQATASAHEPILADAVPRNTAILVNGRVLNPGDSFGSPLLAFAGVELLVLPVMAPFLTEIGALDFARRMRPEAVIPVHDGYARDFFLAQRYETYGLDFDKEGIAFHPLAEPGQSVTI